jgi:hypothetical protein
MKRGTYVTIVFGIILTTGAIAWLFHARSRSARYSCPAALAQIDGAVQYWALDYHKNTNDTPTWEDLQPPRGRLREIPKCPGGGTYSLHKVSEHPRCTIPSHNLDWAIVSVFDDSGSAVPDATVVVFTNSIPAWQDKTSGYGGVRVSTFSGPQTIEISKTGYATQSIPMPTNWPLRITLKQSGK